MEGTRICFLRLISGKTFPACVVKTGESPPGIPLSDGNFPPLIFPSPLTPTIIIMNKLKEQCRMFPEYSNQRLLCYPTMLPSVLPGRECKQMIHSSFQSRALASFSVQSHRRAPQTITVSEECSEEEGGMVQVKQALEGSQTPSPRQSLHPSVP